MRKIVGIENALYKLMKKIELVNILKTLNSNLTQQGHECALCGHPGYAEQDDNSDWKEVHKKGCLLLLVRRGIKKAEEK